MITVDFESIGGLISLYLANSIAAFIALRKLSVLFGIWFGKWWPSEVTKNDQKRGSKALYKRFKKCMKGN